MLQVHLKLRGLNISHQGDKHRQYAQVGTIILKIFSTLEPTIALYKRVCFLILIYSWEMWQYLNSGLVIFSYMCLGKPNKGIIDLQGFPNFKF